MKILAFDTATRATAVALDGVGEDVIEARDDPPGGERPRHAEKLLPLVDSVLESGGIGFEDLELIAVGVGPGTFTGLRIGIATARALAQALSLPLAGVSTLQALAWGASEWPAARGFEVVVPVLDARRGEAFAAAWAMQDVERPEASLFEPAALAPEALAATLRRLERAALAVGDGALEFKALIERSGVSVPEAPAELHRVTAVAHCRIARRLQPTPADRVVPDYLRPPDATVPSPTRASHEQ